ncbi:prolyl oligopeptidase family serine peptidase [Nonomuraea maritima]|uniref:prolyl oligopeptidase family serine peptidase n=1 Tax=Nonomuraea maritima TaxID=683260 RepID=UPI0037222B0F
MVRPRYPQAWRNGTVDILCGFSVPDPYRWLEASDDPRVRVWAAQQDALFAAHRAVWPETEGWRSMIEELSAFGVSDPPLVRGSLMFVNEQLRDDEQRRLVVVAADGTDRRVLVDPVAIDPSGRTRLHAWWPSREGRRVAVQLEVAERLADEIVVLDVRTGETVDGPLRRARNTSLAWLPGEDAFYYVSRVPDDELAPGDQRLHRRVRLHRIGTPPEADPVVFGGPDAPDCYYGLAASPDGRHVAITVADGPVPYNDVWIADPDDPANPRLVRTVDGLATRARVLPRFLPDGGLLLVTDHEAPCGRICTTPAFDADPSQWRTLVPEDTDALLDECVVLDDPALPSPVLVVARARHGVSTLTVHDLDSGLPLTTVPLPGAGVATSLQTGFPYGRHLWFGYCDAATPSTVHRYDPATGETVAEARCAASRPAPAIRSRTVRYPAADGTEITLFLFMPSDDRDGPRPTLLYGYGSFGLTMRPLFSPMAAAWVRAGGIHAVACVRGGGEEGQHWHDAGRGPNKHRAISDFNDAADWLVRTGLTTPGQLASYGMSGGGLLVTAAAMRRPDLYAAVIADGPLCDMVRYERFGLGGTWTEEFGTAADPEQLRWLLGYSPYHRVTPGTSYPAFLLAGAVTDLLTGEAHVAKMCAALQHATSSDRPVLMRREPDGAHAGSCASKERALAADLLAFAGTHTGLAPVRQEEARPPVTEGSTPC